MSNYFRSPWVVALIFLLIAAGLCLSYEFYLASSIRPDYSPTIRGRDGQLLRVDLNSNDQYVLPIRGSVPTSIRQAVIAVEDERFWYHPGVDPIAVIRATWQNVTHEGIKSGASTITMQLARMLYPADRTYWNKFRESVRALMIELQYSKREILKAYLNRLPMGGNRRGIETGARYYFDRSAGGLRFDQAAVLTGIPKNPNLFHPVEEPGNALSRRDFVLGTMAEVYRWSKETLQTVRSREMEATRNPFPHRAPHFTSALRSMKPGESVRGTLDPNIQNQVTDLTNRAHDRLNQRGINHLAVVVLDNESRDILGYEGSGDFYDTTAGRIQGPLIRRSPGSALKPFLYALGIENHSLNPKQRLIDVPVRYSGFRPENFDRTFNGMVTVRRALRGSLNIPAVRYLREVGISNFHRFLEQGPLSLRKEASYYGLGLTLGGAEVRLLQLTNAYASFGDRGRYKPVSWTRSDDPPDSKAWFSPETSHLITTMLGTNHIDGLNLPVALKTGTSAGRRDAWTIAFNSEYTVGVWTGNFNYSNSRFLVGKRAAKPIALKIMRGIHSGGEGQSFQEPDDLEKRRVCSLSGQPPTQHCPDTEWALVPEDQPSGTTCPIHKQVLVSENTPWSHCAYCRPEQARSTVKADYPPVLHNYLREGGQLTNQVPPHDPDCPFSHSQTSLSLIEPGDNTTYWKQGDSKVPVQPASGDSDRRLHLFHNQVYIGQIESGQTRWLSPSEGPHTITVVDRSGRTTTQHFKVKTP